ARENGFSGEEGRVLCVPAGDGSIASALFGIGRRQRALDIGALARCLPEGDWRFAVPPGNPFLAALGLVLGSYAFTRYGKEARKALRVILPPGAELRRIENIADGMFLARDLINTPSNDLGPDALEEAARALAGKHGATVNSVVGDALLEQNFPMIH